MNEMLVPVPVWSVVQCVHACVMFNRELVPCGFIACETINMLCSMNRQKETQVAYTHPSRYACTYNTLLHMRCLFIYVFSSLRSLYFRCFNFLLLRHHHHLLLHFLLYHPLPMCTGFDGLRPRLSFFLLLFSHMILIILIHGRARVWPSV